MAACVCQRRSPRRTRSRRGPPCEALPELVGVPEACQLGHLYREASLPSNDQCFPAWPPTRPIGAAGATTASGATSLRRWPVLQGHLHAASNQGCVRSICMVCTACVQSMCACAVAMSNTVHVTLLLFTALLDTHGDMGAQQRSRRPFVKIHDVSA